MRALYTITFDDYEKILAKAKLNGKRGGDSFEEEFFEYVVENNILPCGHTELEKHELINEYKSKGINAVDANDLLK